MRLISNSILSKNVPSGLRELRPNQGSDLTDVFLGCSLDGTIFVVFIQFHFSNAVHRIRAHGARNPGGHVVHFMGNAERLSWLLFDYRSHRCCLATDGRPEETAPPKGNSKPCSRPEFVDSRVQRQIRKLRTLSESVSWAKRYDSTLDFLCCRWLNSRILCPTKDSTRNCARRFEIISNKDTTGECSMRTALSRRCPNRSER